MAIGFSPKHVKDFNLDTLDKEHFIVLAIEAASKLNWKVSYVRENGFIAYTGINWASFSEEVTVIVDNDVANLKSTCTGTQLIDWGRNKRNIEALKEKIEELKSEMTQEDIEIRLVELRQNYDTNEVDILSNAPLSSKEKISNVFSIFTPTEGYFVTPIIINVNILIFIAMLISGVHILMPENQDLLNWGANFRPLTLEGELWRLLTACFLHIGILHLLLNMYALLYIGILLEPYLGKSRFIAAYLISGIGASLTSLCWHDLTISAGASGAIFGMYGLFLALLTTKLLDKSVKKALTTSIGVFVAYNILNGLSQDSGIDNAAHIGGLLSGLIIGYAFIPSLKQFENKAFKISTISVLIIVLFVSLFTVYKVLPNDIGIYDKEMERFSKIELKALELFNLPEETSKEVILKEIKDNGLNNWNENLKILEGFKNLDLPDLLKERNSILKEYCELRIKTYELIYKSYEEDTDIYINEITQYNQKIESLITKLKSL